MRDRRRFLRRWGREVRLTWALAMPIMAGMVGHMLTGLADTIMVGQVGVVPLAAAAFVNTLFNLPMVFAIGLISSVPVLTAQAFGARQVKAAAEVLRHGLIMAIGAGFLLAGALAGLRPFLGSFGQPPEVVAASGTYLWLVSASLLPMLVAHTSKQFSEALNRPWIPTLIMLAGVFLNIFLNWVFIYGHWGAPALGLEGAGLATVLARTASAIGMVLFLRLAPALQPYNPKHWWIRLDGRRMRRLIDLGWPVAMQHLLEVSAFAFAALMMGWISAQAIAAHQIAITCAATSFMFPLGLGMAICIRVGQAWGARQFKRLRLIGFLGLGMAAMVMSGFALLFILGGELIAKQFVDSTPVVLLAARFLVVAAFFQIADGVQVAAISALRGLTDVRVPAMIAVLSYWVVAVPMGYLLAFRLPMGAVGIWIGLAAGLAMAATTLTWRFHVKSRLRNLA